MENDGREKIREFVSVSVLWQFCIGKQGGVFNSLDDQWRSRQLCQLAGHHARRHVALFFYKNHERPFEQANLKM